jgi:hypothetical protein
MSFNGYGSFGAPQAAPYGAGRGITETLYDASEGVTYVRDGTGRTFAIGTGRGALPEARSILDAIRGRGGDPTPGSVYDVRTSSMVARDLAEQAASIGTQMQGDAGEVIIEGDPGAGQAVDVGGAYQDSNGTVQAGGGFLRSPAGMITGAVVLGGAVLLAAALLRGRKSRK